MRPTSRIPRISLLVPLIAVAGAAAADDAAPQPAREEPPKKALDAAIDSNEDAAATNAYPMPGEIVVSAARGVPLTYAGGRDVIEADTLARYPDGNVTTVLRRVPGVTIIPENGNDSRLNIGLRGSDARRSGLTTILVDGVPISEAPYGNTDVDGLPVAFERVTRIDVIRGGASIRWGPNAAGGVINLVTEPIPSSARARFGMRYGSDRDLSVSTSIGGTWEKFGALVNLVDKRGDGFRENSSYDDRDASAKFRFEFNDNDTLSWGVSRFTELDAAQPGGLTQAAYDDDPWQSLRHGFDFRFTSNRYQADFVHEIEPGSAFQLIAWYHEGFRGLFDFRPVVGPFASRRNQNSDSNSGALEARYTWTTEIFGAKHAFFHSARWLTEKNRELYESIPFNKPPARPYVLDGIFNGSSYAMFHEDTISLTDDLALALGLRSESIDMGSRSRDPLQAKTERNQHYDELLPAASLTWTAAKGLAVYASYQENFLAPQYETGFDPASANYRRVDAEHSGARELGGRYRGIAGLEVTAAYFKTQFSDKLDFANLPSGDKIAVNSGRAQSHGLELGASYDFGRCREELAGLSAYATVTRLNATIESGENEGHDTPNSPRSTASWGVLYEHGSGFWGRLGGSHTGPAFKDAENFHTGNPEGNTGPIPGVTLWDLAIGWHERQDGDGLSVTVGVTNLFEQDYFRRFSTGIYPGAPRQFFVSAGFAMSW